MKQYIYSPAEVGLSQWPSGTLRLEGIEVTANPDEADVFVCPGSLALFRSPADMDRFPYMQGRENRHVFFDVGEETLNYNKPCIYLVCNLMPFMLASNPNALNLAWPVEDYAECMAVPDGGFKYDVSFHGWLSTSTRERSSQSCLDNPNLKCDMARYADFTGYIYHEPEGIRRRAEFRRSMRESRLALCPESIPGNLPYRFFEAMSAARVPVLVSSDYVLPFEDEIPYDDFIARIGRDSAADTGMLIKSYLDQMPDDALIDMGEMARHYWEKYLDSRNWPSLHAYAVQKQMQKMGLTEEVPVLCG